MGVIAAMMALSVAVAPLHVSGAMPHFPRLVRFPDAAVEARVNARLAALEKEQRDGYPQCLEGLKQLGEKPTDDDYWVDVKVGYLSARFLSLEISTESYCGGNHPNNGSNPVTFDLSTGREVDWKNAFKPEFFSVALNALYRKLYPWTAKDEADLRKEIAAGQADESDNCKKLVDGQDNFESPDAAIFRLQAGTGLVVSPDFPHVIQACGEEVALPLSSVAPYLKDPHLLDELKPAK
jgi:hypothetical protein